ncbi:MAG TPA: DNA repair protein RecO [Candidatus Anaerobiospirillum stercoravium]|nr:DNA repair protein RecO [Candidatus Anaerobiospirillum stercoravium]
MPAIVEREPCYIYHIREYQEHSLILEAISLNYGAIAILARGAKRPDSPLQGLIQPFAPLSLSLQLGQKGDLYYLRDFEYCPGGYKFKMPEFFCAFYLNELLHHLYHGKESDRLLFGTYIATLEAIAHNDHIEHNLRNFELSLLKSIGYELSPIDEHGAPVAPDKNYRFCFGQGFIEVDPDFMTQVMTSQRSSATTQAQSAAPAPSPDASATESEGAGAESAMLFAKSKIRGPKLEDTRARLSPGQDAWMRRAMSQGVSSSQIQRYYEYGADLLGPILTGKQIHDIVTLACKLPQSAHNAKLLTASIINRLLGGKELQSRKLYREYLTMLKQKAPNAAPAAASAAEPAALNTDAGALSAEQPQAAEQVKSDSTVADNSPEQFVAAPEASTQEVTEPASEAESSQEDAEPVAEIAPSQEVAEPQAANVEAEPASQAEASQEDATPVVEAPQAESAEAEAMVEAPQAESAETDPVAEALQAESSEAEPVVEVPQVESAETEAVAEVLQVESAESQPEFEAKPTKSTSKTKRRTKTAKSTEPQGASVETEPSKPVTKPKRRPKAANSSVGVEDDAENVATESEAPTQEVAESQVSNTEDEPAAELAPPIENVESEPDKPVVKTKRRTKAAKSHELSEDSAMGAAAKPDAKPKRTKGSAAKSSQAKASSKARKGAGATRKGRSSAAEVAPDEEPEAAPPALSERASLSAALADAQAALVDAEGLLILAPEVMPQLEPEALVKPQNGKQDKQVKKIKKLTRAQLKAQQKAEAEALARAEQERMAASPYDESMLMMLDASLTKRPRRKKTVAH